MSVISIPKFDSPAQIPTEAITAPDAPMTDAPKPPNVASIAPQPPVSDTAFLDSVKEANLKRQESKTVPLPEPKQDPKLDSVPNVFKKAGEEATPPPDDVSDDADDFSDPLDAPTSDKPTKAKNMKELKIHLKTARAREAQLRTRTEELEAEVTRLAAFQDKIDEHERLKERVSQLETYEQIFDIHNNPQFHEKYIEGAETVVGQAKAIAESYGVKDTAIIDHAVKIRNRKDLNDFLKKHVGDELGVQDIRPYIFHLQTLEDERVQLEKSPEEARETLSKMYRESEERRVTEVSKTIHDRSTNAWNQILGYYSRGENAVEAFKEKPGDPEHTTRRAAVLKRSNDEFTKVMGAFTGLGIRDLPAPIAHALAARFQLSEWTGEFIAENKSLKQQVADLTKQLDENSSYTRPSFNGVSRNGNGAAPELPKGSAISEHVFTRARDQVNSRPS